MRKLVVTENISLDGVIEASDYWFGPAGNADPGEDNTDQSDLEDEIRQQREAADAFLVGRTTFEQMRSYWPQQTDDTTGITDYLNKVAKYVVSSSLHDPDWEPTTILRGPLVEEIHRLKSQPGKDIVTTGSITLVHSLIADGLVDEYRLFVYPVIVGRGERLFTDPAKMAKLTLLQTRAFRTGIVLLRYGIT
ncbi:MAG: dihydrofolate reductase family protein [Nakamurella sp.]